MTHIYTNDKTFEKEERLIMIYLDYAATTPMSEEALYVYNEAAKRYFGNASSLHEMGTLANDVLEASRESWAQMIGGVSEGIYFTSGGTEANQLAIRSLIEGNKSRGNHLITTEVEHSSVYNLFKKLEIDCEYEVTYLPLQKNGHISVEQLKNAIRPTTILASIHTVNGETGFIQPVEEIGALLHENNVLFHTDCVQAFGNVHLNVDYMHIDSLSVASHKIYGPKGVGMCYVNPRANWISQIPNTTHEGGFRPGTVDVPAVLSFTTAAQQFLKTKAENGEKMDELRRYFTKLLSEKLDNYQIYESDYKQVPQIIGLTFSKLQGQYIMLECNKYGIAISTGSACQVGQQSPSRTLQSLGKSKDEANQFVRISLGKMTTQQEIDQLINTLVRVVHES